MTRTSMVRAGIALSLGMSVVPPRAAAAQPATPAAEPCDGRIVTAIEYDAVAPAFGGRTVPGWARPVLRVLLQSPRTEPGAVRPFLLLDVGDACTEFRRAESERLLRAQSYIANAQVSAVPDGDGVRLVVRTEDDIALIVGGGVRGGQLSRARFGNGNLFGQGMMAAAEWERDSPYRTGYGGEFEHYHAFGARQVVTLAALRGPRDARYEAAIARPYITDAQNVAWAVTYARDERFLGFPRSAATAPAVQVEREVYGASWVARLGSRGRTVLGGLSLGHERGEAPGSPVFVTDSGYVAADAPDLVGVYRAYDATRAGVIVGTRALAFRRLAVLDETGGTQDVASGVQLLATAGYEFGTRGVAGATSEPLEDRAPFAVADVYAGLASASSLTSLAVLAEGRRALDGGAWEDVAVSGRLGWYRRASERRTHAVSAEFEGAWDARRPYRLTLGAWRQGVRGYGGSQVAGGRLAVLRLEERLAIGGFGGLAGFGLAGFADVGKVWAGDVPYGTTTGVRSSVGVGLLAAVPRRSQRFYRLDVAAPLTSDPDARSVTVRVSRAFPFGTLGRRVGDLAPARAAWPAAALLPPP